MDLRVAIASGVGALVMTVVFGLGERRREPLSLSERKPRFCRAPWYTATAWLPPSLSNAPDRTAALQMAMSRFGFRLVLGHEDGDIIYEREGRGLRDLSIRWVKLKVAFAPPIAAETPITVQYDQFVAFDTGDLWTFTHELLDALAEDDQPSRLS